MFLDNQNLDHMDILELSFFLFIKSSKTGLFNASAGIIVAVDQFRHFQRAAEKCFVIQATLSMMIQKLEEKLGVLIFDRSKHPVKPTDIGTKIILQARVTLTESSRMKEIILEEKGEIGGEFRLGIIPTLAPYLLPLFLRKFTTEYPQVSLVISEHTTTSIIHRLKSGHLDAALLATPLSDPLIREVPIFYEKYFLYVSDKEKGFDKKYVLPSHIDISHLWLLEEGHCMRSQILNLCELKKQHEAEEHLHYEAGSIESLKNLVENDFGLTIIPELSTFYLTGSQKKRLRYFKAPTPVREISIVTNREYIKQSLIDRLKECILSVIPKDMKNKEKVNVLDI